MFFPFATTAFFPSLDNFQSLILLRKKQNRSTSLVKMFEIETKEKKNPVEDQFDKSKLNQQKITEGKNTKFFCLC